ncbi:Fe-S cluster assembly protein HesB, partial [Mycobacterium stomatepiae]|nr:Fe-S cluster assembly protein HesB [Mycobacterium stomatepiae]
MELAFAGPKKIADRLARNRVDTSQQIPMEVAFGGPKKIADRMGGLDPHEIAGRDPEEFAALFAEKPAVHRFPGSMAGRVQALAKAVSEQYGG